MSHPIEAVCFDFAGTLFNDRDLRSVHLQQLRFVADAAGARSVSDQEPVSYTHLTLPTILRV